MLGTLELLCCAMGSARGMQARLCWQSLLTNCLLASSCLHHPWSNVGSRSRPLEACLCRRCCASMGGRCHCCTRLDTRLVTSDQRCSMTRYKCLRIRRFFVCGSLLMQLGRPLLIHCRPFSSCQFDIQPVIDESRCVHHHLGAQRSRRNGLVHARADSCTPQAVSPSKSPTPPVVV